mgnify:CR=1 FL=1
MFPVIFTKFLVSKSKSNLTKILVMTKFPVQKIFGQEISRTKIFTKYYRKHIITNTKHIIVHQKHVQSYQFTIIKRSSVPVHPNK